MRLLFRRPPLPIAISVIAVLMLCVLTRVPPLLAQHPAGHGQSGQAPARPAPEDKHANVMAVSPERLQSIGVKFALAKRRPLDQAIRTVGLVEMDERRLAHVNIKLEGWIDELRVSSTGERVTKGQILFTLYSPELVATQTEYLLAVRSRRTLGESTFPEVAEGAKSLLESARRRLKLWDITEDHIED
jgi:membrane fusion protein, copper/silver efflux system